MDKEKNTDFKIYTKQGDEGKTSLLGGSRVSKYHEKIEAYGTLDELNAFIGLLRDQDDICDNTRDFLYEIQEKVFASESIIATDSEELLENLPKVDENDIKNLEEAIDNMNNKLPELQNFIIPGGHKAVSHAHVARTVCRRAERQVLQANDIYPVNDHIIQYLNRLSDYFFVLARYLAQNNDVTEKKWKTS